MGVIKNFRFVANWVVLTIIFVPLYGDAHPGGTDDKGCHVCRTNCDEWGVDAGEKHCHGEDDAEEQKTEETGLNIEAGQEVRVLEVIDGDTLTVRVDDKKLDLRLLGIDCPESQTNSKCRRDGDCQKDIPKGKKATTFVRELVSGETVELEPGDNGFEKGSYDRLLAYVRTDGGKDLGLQLVEVGLCSDYGHEYPHSRGDKYRGAEP